MKKWLFAVLMFVLVLFSTASMAYAHTYVFSDEEYIDFTCTSNPGAKETVYQFKFIAYNLSCTDAKTIYYVNSNGEYIYACSVNPSRLEYDSEGIIVKDTATAECTLSNDLDITDFVIKVGIQYASVAFETFYFDADYQVATIPTLEPTVVVNVAVDGSNASCSYKTGGCDSVSSKFELQWFSVKPTGDDVIWDALVDDVEFVDGNGTYNCTLISEGWYRAVVSYTYRDSSGVEQTKTACSDFFKSESVNEKPTVTPEPTATPLPTPTSTPTPSPTPAPEMMLNAYLDENNNAVAEYQTGGCTPVRSNIALYEMLDKVSYTGTMVEQKNFVSGSGSMSKIASMGNSYRYKLTYTYTRNGVQYTDELWSDLLEYKDTSLDEYNKTGNITNFKELIVCVWNEFFGMDVNVEGFDFTFKDLFFWIVVATLLLMVIFKFIKGD